MTLKLTRDKYVAAGKEILAHPWCSAATKAVVRQVLNGGMDSEEMYTYIPVGDTWYDRIMQKHATADW